MSRKVTRNIAPESENKHCTAPAVTLLSGRDYYRIFFVTLLRVYTPKPLYSTSTRGERDNPVRVSRQLDARMKREEESEREPAEIRTHGQKTKSETDAAERAVTEVNIGRYCRRKGSEKKKPKT